MTKIEHLLNGVREQQADVSPNEQLPKTQTSKPDSSIRKSLVFSLALKLPKFPLHPLSSPGP